MRQYCCTNKALLPVADRIAFGFDGAAATTHKRAVVTGNPVREEIEAMADRRAVCRAQRALQLSSSGGSLGAKAPMRPAAGAGADRCGARARTSCIKTGALQRDAVREAYAAAA